MIRGGANRELVIEFESRPVEDRRTYEEWLEDRVIELEQELEVLKNELQHGEHEG